MSMKVYDMHVPHLQHLFPCNIYMSCHMCVHLIINPICINQTYSIDSLNSDTCTFVPVQIPETVIKATSTNSIFKTFKMHLYSAIRL